MKVGASEGQSYYRTLMGNHTQSIEWYHFHVRRFPKKRQLTRVQPRLHLKGRGSSVSQFLVGPSTTNATV